MANAATPPTASWRRSQVYVIIFALFCQSVVVGYLAVELRLKASRRAIHTSEHTIQNACGSEEYNERTWLNTRRSFTMEVEDTSCYKAASIIPVLGVSVLHDPFFFFSRFIYSIDFPVAHLVVVYNGADPDVAHQVEAAFNQTANMTLIRQEGHFGVSEGWNLITQAFPAEDWVMIASYDVAFIRGHLRKFASTFVQDESAEQASMRPINTKADLHNPCGVGAYNVLGIKSSLVRRGGYFDENIYPAYFEDDEWNIRLERLDPPGVRACYSDVVYVHGRRTDRKHVTGILRLGDSAASQVLATKNINWEYVAQKWGCQLVGSQRAGMHPVNCTHSNPFNNSHLPVSHWSLDRRRRGDIQAVMAAWAASEAQHQAALAADKPAQAAAPCDQKLTAVLGSAVVQQPVTTDEHGAAANQAGAGAATQAAAATPLPAAATQDAAAAAAAQLPAAAASGGAAAAQLPDATAAQLPAATAADVAAAAQLAAATPTQGASATQLPVATTAQATAATPLPAANPVPAAAATQLPAATTVVDAAAATAAQAAAATQLPAATPAVATPATQQPAAGGATQAGGSSR